MSRGLRNWGRVWLAGGLALVMLCPLAHADRYFDPLKEFPNLFLPKEHRGKDPDKIPADVVRDARKDMEAALKSLFTRLVVPVNVVKGDKTVVELVPYFEHFQKQLAGDPKAKLMPSGGVVRAAIAKLYWEMAAGEAQGRSAQQTLKDIAALGATPQSRAKHPVSIQELQGLGSDFDMQLRTSKTPYADAKRIVLDGTATPRPFIDKSSGMSRSYRRSLFPEIEISPFEDVYGSDGKLSESSQFRSASRQGAATNDLLVFDIEEGKIVTPSRFPDVVEDMMRGKAGYAGPEDGDESIVGNKHKRTIRGVRAMLELPWLRVDPTSEKRLIEELKALKEFVDKGGRLDAATLDQIEKAWRNVAPSGANNRFYRAKPDTLDALVLQTAKAISKTHYVDVIPEFLPRLDLGRPVVDELPKGAEHLAVPDKLHARLKAALPGALMSREKFIETKTNKGHLVHGIPNTNGALAILGGNLLLSREGQGRAIHGRGAYFTDHDATAHIHASQDGSTDGVVIHLKLVEGKEIRVLDWESFKRTLAGQELLAHAGSVDRAFEILAERYGIDIIINHHVIVQNAAVLAYPKGKERFPFLIDSYASRAKNPALFPEARLRAFETHKRLIEYARNVGEPVPDTVDRVALLRELEQVVRTHHEPHWRKAAAVAVIRLAALGDKRKALAAAVPLLRSEDRGVREAAEAEVRNLMPDDKAEVIRVLSRSELLPDLMRHGDAKSFEHWSGTVTNNWQPENWRDLPKILEGQSSHAISKWLKAAVAAGHPAEDVVKAWDPLTRGLYHAHVGTPSAEGKAAAPLLKGDSLSIPDYKAAAKHLGLTPAGLAKIDPVLAASTLDWILRTKHRPKPGRGDFNAPLFADVVSENGLGKAEDWEGASKEIERRLKQRVLGTSVPDDVSSAMKALFELPYHTTHFDFLGAPEKLSTGRALGIVRALESLDFNHEPPGALEFLAKLHAHANADVRREAARFLAMELSLVPRLAHRILPALQKFGPDSVEPLFSDRVLPGDPNSALTAIRKHAPELWTDALVRAATSKPPRIHSSTAVGFLSTFSDGPLLALRAAGEITAARLQSGEDVGPLIDLIHDLALKTKDLPHFRTIADGVIRQLDKYILGDERVTHQPLREAIGSALFFLGAKSDSVSYRQLALNRTRGRHAEDTFRRLIAMATARPDDTEGVVDGLEAIATRNPAIEPRAKKAIDDISNGRCPFSEYAQ